MSTDVLHRSRRTPSTPLIDPRLRDRRIEVARDQGRRRLRRLLIGLGLLALVGGTVAATRSPLLDVDRITVSGAASSGDDAVREAAGIARGTALVSVDTAAAERRLEALPWVADASVSRRWPDAVAITVTEREPVAVVGTGADAVLVDADGRVLGDADGADGLPTLAGDPVPVGSALPSGRRAALAVLSGLPAALRSEVAEAGAQPSGTVLELRDGIRVRWGDTGQPTAKADALQVLLAQADRTTIATIDVSVPRATTLTRKTGEA